MLTAEETRKITDAASVRELRGDLQGVEHGIENAAECNYREYVHFTSIRPQIIKVLEDSGYKARQEKAENGKTMTYISW